MNVINKKHVLKIYGNFQNFCVDVRIKSAEKWGDNDAGKVNKLHCLILSNFERQQGTTKEQKMKPI